ncbi:MAG: hypothetical protein GXN92_03745 [Candidatus Micrarchaeota archaeon]|nr:hypothetical protein [Candidatus Micrarchaeota archaeon]
MVCERCAYRYNVAPKPGSCPVCYNIFEKLESLQGLEGKAAIRISGFNEENYLFNPRSTLASDIRKFILERNNLVLDYDNAETIINVTPEGYSLEKGDLFLFGRYFKLKNMISQKRWHRKKWNSVEEIIGDYLSQIYKPKAYYMHASGREDVDAFNIGGRAFVMELQKPESFQDFQGLIETPEVVAIIYGKVPRSFVKLVSDSHFDKLYLCHHDPFSPEERKKLESTFQNLVISQYTPKRVENRRAKKTRKKTVYWVKSFETFTYVAAEAGTYIKELFHGDEGRTTPSFSEVLGREVRCRDLTVVKTWDFFLDVLKNVRER